MTEQQYVKEVGRRLHCSKEKRMEIERQLASDIKAALECGESLEDILERMGPAKTAAAEFNANFTEEELEGEKKSRGRLTANFICMACVVCMVIAACISAGTLIRNRVQDKKKEAKEAEPSKTEQAADAGGSGEVQPQAELLADDDPDFSKEVLQQETEKVIGWFQGEEYSRLLEQGTDNLKQALNGVEGEALFKEAKEQISKDWGAFVSFGNAYMSKVTESGAAYAVVQINASYEKISVTYTIVFNQDMKVDGFYVK